MPSPGFFYAFIVPEIFAAPYVYGVVISVCLVPSEEAKDDRLGTSIDDSQEIMEEYAVRVVIVSPRGFRQFPHTVMHPTGGGNAQAEELVKYVETTVPLLGATARWKFQRAICWPLEGIVIWYDEEKVSVKADFFRFHQPPTGSKLVPWNTPIPSQPLESRAPMATPL